MAKKDDSNKKNAGTNRSQKATDKKEAIKNAAGNSSSKQHEKDNKKNEHRTTKNQTNREQSSRKRIIINSQTISELSEHLPDKGEHKIGKRLLIAFIILICLCGLAFGLSKAGIIPLTIKYLENQGLLIEFTDPIEFYRQKLNPQENSEAESSSQQTSGSDSAQSDSTQAQTQQSSAQTGTQGSEQNQTQQQDSTTQNATVTSPDTTSVTAENVSPGAAGTTATLLLPDSLEIPLCPPGSHDHERRSFAGFTACYRENYEQPEWVAYTLTPEKLVKEADRANNFRADPQISTGSATPDDYKSSGYDRGHLAPAADMAYNETTMRESFYMSNMSPQEPSFNRGIWNNLENDVRAIAAGCDCLYVVTGPILEKPASEYASIGANKVSVPEFYYKVLLAVTYKGTNSGGVTSGGDVSAGSANTVTAYAYIVPNGKTDENPNKFMCTIDDVEKRTGIDFFSLLEDDLEDKLEMKIGATASVQ